ncbi:MAG: hypothetical protein IPO09_05980 [Anaeromyxobacter sp.]|nr:hypothetical protein [Anaeromyxobacter sp.]MBL0277218.1 hypothetical protein [Anaeromyxobacter sp.]
MASLVACGGSGDSGAVPGAPTAVAAALGATSGAVVVTFSPPVDAGSGPITGYTVTSTPAGVTASGVAAPITVSCGGPCAGRAFSVSATSAAGTGAASAPAHVVTAFDVVETFLEPMTQPNDSIFTGTFTLDSTTRTVSNLQGSLTQSMTMPGQPMTTVGLTHQLSAVSDGLGGNGLLVTTFLLGSVDTFYPGGFDPHDANAVYFGFPDPWSAATANAYARILVDTDDPTATLSQAQRDLLAYADCTAGGMMGSVCMTGTTVAGYGHVGSMAGYPVSQVVTRQ